ncbi:hypothetical protein CEY02_15825 [Bacillus pumilus]|uniref:Uncharacterized protein n=1 Tax=Bacillus pumilus TaxID=1408 RepID=A0A2A5IRS1_BACPU|nr:hypothetical protein [Bacillus pumilus]PCK20005.1 hypothetical protein CEY02_15825 [Bacillus pumilus]
MTFDELMKLSEEEFINYDFKKEIFNLRHLKYDENNPIANIILYKGNIYGSLSDCDRLPLILEIYKRLWGNEFEFWNTKQTDFVEANGETMNSFVTPYKALYKETYNLSNPLFNEYAILTHTVGNFIPVYAIEKDKNWSSPFNIKRYSSTYDYWDITLNHIKVILNDVEDSNESIENFFKILQNSNSVKYKKYIIESAKWILSFNTWPNFVEKNFLQSFLENPKDLTSEPKEFWRKHFKETVSTKDENNLIEFLTFVNNAIKERSSLIYKQLHSKNT